MEPLQRRRTLKLALAESDLGVDLVDVLLDSVGVAPLIAGIEFDALLGDKAFDADWLIADLNERRAKVVISQMPQRRTPLAIDKAIYKWRHLIENFFCKLKEFKRIALRSDKTDDSFRAMIHLGAAVINSR